MSFRLQNAYGECYYMPQLRTTNMHSHRFIGIGIHVCHIATECLCRNIRLLMIPIEERQPKEDERKNEPWSGNGEKRAFDEHTATKNLHQLEFQFDEYVERMQGQWHIKTWYLCHCFW